LIFGLFHGKNRYRFTYNRKGGRTMKCYVCAKQGVDKDAVAICIICGMGLCLGHAFKEELLVKDIIDWGFGEERIEYPHTLPRFLCAECKLAREQRIRVIKGKSQT
jgi:hypothetical protein